MLEILAIYDSKARAFLTPIFSPRIETGLRAIRGAVNAPGTHLYQYPEDYTVFYVGKFNDETGTFESFSTPRNLGLCTQFKDPIVPPTVKEITVSTVQEEVKENA